MDRVCSLELKYVTKPSSSPSIPFLGANSASEDIFQLSAGRTWFEPREGSVNDEDLHCIYTASAIWPWLPLPLSLTLSLSLTSLQSGHVEWSSTMALLMKGGRGEMRGYRCKDGLSGSPFIQEEAGLERRTGGRTSLEPSRVILHLGDPFPKHIHVKNVMLCKVSRWKSKW